MTFFIENTFYVMIILKNSNRSKNKTIRRNDYLKQKQDTFGEHFRLFLFNLLTSFLNTHVHHYKMTKLEPFVSIKQNTTIVLPPVRHFNELKYSYKLLSCDNGMICIC